MVWFSGFNVPLDTFWRRFYGSDDPTNSVTALKDGTHSELSHSFCLTMLRISAAYAVMRCLPVCHS